MNDFLFTSKQKRCNNINNPNFKEEEMFETIKMLYQTKRITIQEMIELLILLEKEEKLLKPTRDTYRSQSHVRIIS